MSYNNCEWDMDNFRALLRDYPVFGRTVPEKDGVTQFLNGMMDMETFQEFDFMNSENGRLVLMSKSSFTSRPVLKLFFEQGRRESDIFLAEYADGTQHRSCSSIPVEFEYACAACNGDIDFHDTGKHSYDWNEMLRQLNANGYVRRYQSDLLWHDRNFMNRYKPDSMLFLVRDTGTWVIPNSQENEDSIESLARNSQGMMILEKGSVSIIKMDGMAPEEKISCAKDMIEKMPAFTYSQEMRISDKLKIRREKGKNLLETIQPKQRQAKNHGFVSGQKPGRF